MAQISIQLTGLKKLRQAMKSAPMEVARELDKGIKKSVISLERTAKHEAPVDTGRLRSSHRTELSKLRGELFPTVSYALFVHEPGRTRNWSGDPWLARTIKQEQRNIESIMQKSVNKAIRKAFR